MAGLDIAFLCATVILGINIPLVIDETSNIADESDRAPVLLIEMLCEKDTLQIKLNKINTKILLCFMV